MGIGSGSKILPKQTRTGLFSLLTPYRGFVILLVLFALAGNGANLIIPRIISKGIDTFTTGDFVMQDIILEFAVVVLAIFIFTLAQMTIQTYTAERVGLDLRKKLADKISQQSYAFIQEATPAKLLTNLTSDMDSVKMFVSQAITSIISSAFMIIGTSILLIIINWQLALPVILMIPLIGIAFNVVLRKVKTYFRRSREVVDWLNKVINESILGAAIIRVLNSQQLEYKKFLNASAEARDVGISIVSLFATLIPLITFLANIATLTILALGGHMVISGNLTIGDFAAFNSYVSLLIFPIIVIGFMSNTIARASASYERINRVLQAAPTTDPGTLEEPLHGNIRFRNVSVEYDGKPALKNITLDIKAGTRTAIIGPTAAGKTQLLYLLTGLVKASSGIIEFDGIDIKEYRKENFYNQIGFVFQDSVLFNMSLRENIAFSDAVTDESLQKAIETAGLAAYIKTLPDKLDSVVSERGTSLSGGQKQRIMLARALALNPRILLLDDFTARVDQQTEQKIVRSVLENYPGITLISVTQKIDPVKKFDQIVLLMEGELVAAGDHDTLMASCPEYVQINESQKSTSHYEL